MPLLAVTLGATAIAVAQEPQNPDPVIVEQPGLSAPSTHGGVQVWLRGSGMSFRLVQRVDGQISDAPIAPFDDAKADPSLGTDSQGRVTVVYSRCPGRRRAENCDVYSWRPGTNEPEARLRAASGRDCQELHPAIHEGRVAFARARRSRRCAAGLWLTRGRRAVRRDGRVPDGIDLGARFVAVVLVRSTTDEGNEVDDYALALFRPARGRARVVARESNVTTPEGTGEGANMSDPILDGGFVYYGRDYSVVSESGGGDCHDLIRVRSSGRNRGALPERVGTQDAGRIEWAVSGTDIFYARLGQLRQAADSPPSFEQPPCVSED